MTTYAMFAGSLWLGATIGLGIIRQLELIARVLYRLRKRRA